MAKKSGTPHKRTDTLQPLAADGSPPENVTPGQFEIEARAVTLVKQRNRDAKDFTVYSVVPDFLNGSLVFVEFEDSDGEDDENYVYIDRNGEAVICLWFQDVASLVAQRSGHTPRSLALQLLSVGGVAGLIAVLITLTIAFILIRDASDAGNLKDHPLVETMKNALVIILGFYFGSKVSAK